jgi:uncharacterized membrane protein
VTIATGYALAAMVCYGLADYIFKRSAQAGVPAHLFLVAQAWCFFPMTFGYALLTQRLVIALPVLWGLLAGLFVYIGLYYFLRSLVAGLVSITAPIFRLNFIVTAFLAIVLLREPLTMAKLIGFLLALIAVWLLLGALDRGYSLTHKVTQRSLIQVSIATVAFGASNFFHKMGVEQGILPETMVAMQAAAFCPLATLFAWWAEGQLPPPVSTWRHALPSAIVLLFATLFLLHSLALGPASVLVPIAQMGFVVPAALGIAVLGEQLTLRKVAGLAAAVAALGALAMA